MPPDLREGDLADRRGGAAVEELLMVLFVHCLTDVVGGEGGKNQSLNSTGEKAQEHCRQGHNQGHQKCQNCNHQFIRQDVAKRRKERERGLVKSSTILNGSMIGVGST